MKKRYDIIGNPKKLENETSNINERFRILYKDGVTFEFFDIVDETFYSYEEVNGEQVVVEGSGVTTFKKISGYEDVIIDDEVVGQKPIYIEYTPEFEVVLNLIDNIIMNHPTNDPDPNLTPDERIDRLELIVLQTEGVI